MTLWTHSNVVSVTSVPIWLQLSGWWWTITPTDEPGPAQGVLQLKNKGFCFFLWCLFGVSYLNRKDNNVKEAADKRNSDFPKAFLPGGQLGAAAGSRWGVCVTRTLRTVRDNSTSVCRAQSLRHLVWNQISVKTGGIMERRDDLRGAFSCFCFWEDERWTPSVAFNSFRLGRSFYRCKHTLHRKYVNSLFSFLSNHSNRGTISDFSIISSLSFFFFFQAL